MRLSFFSEDNVQVIFFSFLAWIAVSVYFRAFFWSYTANTTASGGSSGSGCPLRLCTQPAVISAAVSVAWLAFMRYYAHGPNAKYLPENAKTPADFAKRPLDARPWAGRVVVVTGSSCIGGIGFQTAKSASFLGAHVVMVDMIPEKELAAAEDAIRKEDPSASLKSVRLNLANFDDIQPKSQEIVDAACALRGMKKTVNNNSGCSCIDILVNNAGIGRVDRATNTHGFDLQFAVNYLGAFLLAERLEAHIVSGTGRIVNLASCAHMWWVNTPNSLNPQTRVIRLLDDVNDPALVVPTQNPYALSKFCMLTDAAVRARRLAARGVRTASVHPGAVFSQIWRFIQPRPLKLLVDAVMSLGFKDPFQGHQTTLDCMTRGNLISGQFYADCQPFRPRDEGLSVEIQEAIDAWTRKKLAKWLA